MFLYTQSHSHRLGKKVPRTGRRKSKRKKEVAQENVEAGCIQSLGLVPVHPNPGASLNNGQRWVRTSHLCSLSG